MQKPRRLPHQKDVRVPVQLLRRHGRSTQDHHRAKQTERERDAKEPSVTVRPSRHVGSPPSQSRARSLSLELLHKLLENAAAVLIVLKLVETEHRGRVFKELVQQLERQATSTTL